VRPLADHDFNPSLPLQTKRGAKQALRCGHNKIDDLIKSGKLKTVSSLGRLVRITTESILEVAAVDDDQTEVAA
jgi:hypothetical protein